MEGETAIETARVKYVFVDVVRFTAGRSVEAQSYIVEKMNLIVREAAKASGASESQTIFIPTGDGIAIALIDEAAFDVHIKVALYLLKLLAEHNASSQPKSRTFQLRIGINENVDNLITDINNRRNVAGRGVAMAQRIMDKADGNQILVGEAVYDALRSREYYMKSFRQYRAVDKHGEAFQVYQFCPTNNAGLNSDPPKAFTRKAERPKLSRFSAYYIAYAAMHRDFLISKNADPARDYIAVVLLSLLADDSISKADAPPHEPPDFDTWHAGKASFDQQYDHYGQMDFTARTLLARLLEEKNLESYADLFETNEFMTNFAFVKPIAVKRVQQDWPQIAKEFGLESEALVTEIPEV